MMIVVAVAVILSVTCGFYRAIRLSRWWRGIVLGGVSLVILGAPLLIDPRMGLARLLVAILAVAEVVKLFDIHHGLKPGERPGFGAFVVFLVNPFSVVLRKLESEPRPGFRADLIQAGRGFVGTAIGAGLLVLAFGIEWRGRPFAVEHSVKVLAFFLMLVPGLMMGSALWRLVGGRGRNFMDNPFVATTPADFWRRYNRPAQQFFREDVFKPMGGARHPLRAALATFAVSGLVHEYAFDVAAGRVQGLQSLFFLVQGAAVVATGRLRPRGAGRVGGMAATLAFNLAASVLFFVSLDEILPFHQRR